MKKPQINKKDIAIVGVSCEFPQSMNAQEFWRNLVAGNELIHFYTDEELAQLGVQNDIINNPNFIKAHATLDDPGSFDYSFFGYTKEEANCMDPQTRMLHQQVWQALEDAGCDIATYKGKIGMYVSASDNLNWLMHTLLNPSPGVNSFYQSQLSNRNFAHTLVSYCFDLKGPSLLIDTACSSSLSSIHIACRNLLLRECSMAVAAGVSVDTTTSKGYFYQEGMISSKDGHCKAFDVNSSGTIGGNGGATVVLKRLEDAVNDRDHVYAVIKASAVNNDGRRKVGYTAPSVAGQSDCIKLAHKIANVSPDSISYVEAHGTGTNLGDPIEIESLNKAFNYNTKHRCAIGSVKTNLGHLDAAAGVAGLLKTALALKHKKLPASLHFTAPNPEINFASGPFYVNPTFTDWKAQNGTPLRAGVSSFGIGGTNVHVVMEEAPVREQGSISRPWKVIPFSAKTKTSIAAYQEKLQSFLGENQDDLADLAYTLATGRKAFGYRNYIVASNHEDAKQQLEEMIATEQPAITGGTKDIVFLFSGQGSQYLKMGKALYDQESDVKAIMDEGFELLQQLTGKSLKTIMGYDDATSQDPTAINQTENTQPLLFLIEYALAKLLMKWGMEPTLMMGHSLGEYTAACISGVFSFEEALKIIVKRGRLMHKMEAGTMAGVGASVEEIRGLLPKGISIAAENTKSSCVISGNTSQVEAFVETLKDKNIPCRILKTSHAFHSEMMEPMLEAFKKVFDTIQLAAPKRPFISNRTGKAITTEEATSPAYWATHLRDTVNFVKGLDTIFEKNTDTLFVEIGPGKTLATFSRQHPEFAKNDNRVVTLLPHPKETVDGAKFFAKAIGQLWSSGASIDWKTYYEGEIRNKITAPTYSFDRKHFESLVDPLATVKNNGLQLQGIKRNQEHWYYTPNWKKGTASYTTKETPAPKTYLIFADESAFTASLIQELKDTKNTVISIHAGEKYEELTATHFTINLQQKSDLTTLFDTLEKRFPKVEHILYNWSLGYENDATMVQSFMSQLALYKSIIDAQTGEETQLTLLTSFGHHILGHEKTNISAITAMSLAKVFAQENAGITTKCIDIDSESNTTAVIPALLHEITADSNEFSIAFRNNSKWVAFYETTTIPTQTVNTLPLGKTYVITGGLGKLGTLLATHLCKTYQASVILLGRTALPAQEDWAQYVENPATAESLVKKIKTLQAFHDQKLSITYYQADVSDEVAFQKAMYRIEEAHGNISGIIHAAGNISQESFKAIEHIQEADAKAQFAPKIQGLHNIHNWSKIRTLDFVWITSSLSATVGGLTYGAYAFANKYMDAFVLAHQHTLENWHCVNLDGLSEGRINDSELIDVFETSLKMQEHAQLIVSVQDIQQLESIQKETETTTENTLEEMQTDRPQLSVSYKAPENEIQEQLCELWANFFGYEKVGIRDDFFELGGDSLKAMTLVKRVQKLFDMEVHLQEFYTKSTIKDLAEEIEIAQKVKQL
jgi:acyl transferase domain-containing protein/acyl carrier protein